MPLYRGSHAVVKTGSVTVTVNAAVWKRLGSLVRIDEARNMVGEARLSLASAGYALRAGRMEAVVVDKEQRVLMRRQFEYDAPQN